MTTGPATLADEHPRTADAIAALDRLEEIGYPTKKDEAWRYAPHGQLADLAFGPTVELTADVPADLDELIPPLDGPRIVVVNGRVDLTRSNLTAPDGLRVAALADDPTRAGAGLGSDPAGITDAYHALNIAYGRDGAVIEVADGAVIDQPVHVVDVEIPDETQNASCTRVVIELGVGSSATVVETRIGVGTEFGGSNIGTTITLGVDATLEHVLLQDVPPSQIHLSRVDVGQSERSTYRARSFNLGAAYGRVDYRVQLGGEGALAELSGLFFGFGDQVLDQQITVVHAAPGCTSRQAFRGVLDDRSTGVFNGGIDVRPGADGTDAEQSNDNLLLSDRAEINTQPRLEILADEVACAHGATVGQLDDDALYYMRSRGLAVDEARRLLINGFADRVVDGVGIEGVRTWITHRLGHDDV